MPAIEAYILSIEGNGLVPFGSKFKACPELGERVQRSTYFGPLLNY
jgi:hypothetical protein